MIRAKEYAKQYLDNPIDQNLFKIAKAMFITEMNEIANSRNKGSKSKLSNTAIISIYREQCKKYAAFARHVNKALGNDLLLENGFERFVKYLEPEIYELIKVCETAQSIVNVKFQTGWRR